MYTHRYTQWDIDLINRATVKIMEGSHTLTAILIKNLGGMLWEDFINADPADPRAMWLVYLKFVRAMKTLKDTITEMGGSYTDDIRDKELLSKAEFLKRYPESLQEDAEKLHSGMKRVIDEDMTEVITCLAKYIGAKPRRMTKKRQEEQCLAHETISGGANIPELFFTILPRLKQVDGGYHDEEMELYIPSCEHPNFWLSVIKEGMMTQSYDYQSGQIMVKRCAGKDCRRYFVPAYRSHDQQYHSTSCYRKQYMKAYRKKHRKA